MRRLLIAVLPLFLILGCGKPATQTVNTTENAPAPESLVAASRAALPTDYMKYFSEYTVIKPVTSSLQMYLKDLADESRTDPYVGLDGIQRFFDKWNAAKKHVTLPELTPTPDEFIEKTNETLGPQMAKEGWWFDIDIVPAGPETSQMVVRLGAIVASKTATVVTTEGKETTYTVQLVNVDSPENFSDARTTGTTISIFPLPQWRSASVMAETLRIGHGIEPEVDRQVRARWKPGTSAEAIYTDLLRYIEKHEVQHIKDKTLLDAADEAGRDYEARAKLKTFFEARGYVAAIAEGRAENAAAAHLKMVAIGDYGLNSEGASLGVQLMDPHGRGLPLDPKTLREQAKSALAKTDEAVRLMSKHVKDPDPYEYGRKVVEAATK